MFSRQSIMRPGSSSGRPRSSRYFNFVFATAGVLFAVGVDPAAAQLTGAGQCGQYEDRAPSTLPRPAQQFLLQRDGTGNPFASPAIRKIMTSFRGAVVCLINAERKARGLPELTPSTALRVAAVGHARAAQDLKWWTGDTNPHINPQTQSTIESRIKRQGYCNGNPKRVSEITYTWAGSEASPRGAVNWWMNISKSGHREAIIDPAIREYGLGVSSQVANKNVPAQSNMGTYVIDFGACP
jgi:uncharacterized protein YkwD